MNEYKASNGVEVAVRPHGSSFDYGDEGETFGVDARGIDALREFVRAERDELIERAPAQNAPMTAQEIIQHIRFQLGVWVSESRVTTGVAELRELGAIRQDGERRNPSGYAAAAWRLTDET